MFESLSSFFDTSGFMPHGHCYLWKPSLVYMNVISDSIIFASYLTISLTLALLVVKVKEIPFQNIYLAFGLFIVACGFTHFMEIINVWTPTYWVTGSVKVLTAIASLGTAASLPFFFPKVRDLARGADLLRAQNALRESEMLYRQIVDTANEGIWLLDLDGRTKFVNQRMATMLGYTQEELEGRALFDFVDEEGRKAYEKHVSFKPVGLSDALEVAMYPKDGNRIFVRVLCNDIHDKDGSIIGALGMVTDVTRKIQAEQALKASELHFRSLIESLPQLVWSSSESDTAGYLNQNLRKQLGQEPQNIFEEMMQALHPDDRAQTEGIWRQAFHQGHSVECEYRLRHADESYRWQLGRITPIRNPDGSIAKWVGISTDIHEQKEAQRSIVESQLTLKAALHNMDAFLWAVDSQLVLTTCEDTPPNDPILPIPIQVGRSMLEYFPESSERIQAIRGALSGRSLVYEVEVGAGYRENRITPLRDVSGEVVGVVGLSVDVTERKRAAVREEGALEASRLKSEFLANMSHEIRTPLNGVLGMTALLGDTDLSEQQSEMVRNARRSGEALLIVLNDILDFSKIEAGKLDFEALDFDLPALLEDAEKMIFYAAREKSIHVIHEFSEDLPQFVEGDPGRLRQVLWNLLSNAIKFTSKGSIVLRALKLPSEAGVEVLRFEVSDTGIGISAKAQENLFTAFSQADSSTTRRFGGTGLGLSIVKKLVDRMDGEIGVQSQVGQGSTFWFTVRLKKGREVFEEIDTRIMATEFPDARILVADDNIINRMVVLQFLTVMGYQAEAVNNGNQVLETLEKKNFDLILMDCHMPGMDGYECTSLIRKSFLEFKNILIVALTASVMKRDHQRCLDVGMDGFIPKPIRKAKLFDTIEGFLKDSKLDETPGRKSGSPPRFVNKTRTESTDSF